MQDKKLGIRIGKNIKSARKEKGISQKVLGEAIGVTYQQIQNYEKAHNRISASKLYYIAITLNKPIKYFFKHRVK